MKNLCLVLACVLMIVMISLPAFASDDDPYSGDSPQDVWVEGLPSPEPVVSEDPVASSDPEPVVSEEPVTATDPEPAETEGVTEPEVFDDGETEADSGEVSDAGTYSDDGSSVSDSSGTSEVLVIVAPSQVIVRDTVEYSSDYSASLMSAIYAVFGEYTPRTYEVTTYFDDGTAVTSTEIVPGLAGLDYNWIAGVALFFMALFCIFRMIGGMFRWK